MALALLAGLGLSRPADAGESTRSYAEEERVSCGPRVVFTLARRLGREVTYESIRRRMHLTADGTTIGDIKGALNQVGIACAVRRLDPTELFSAPTPLIAHIKPIERGPTEGHYLIVDKIGPAGLDTYDPYTGRASRWPWKTFSDIWSGHVVMPERSTLARLAWLAPVAALGVHLLALVGLVASIRAGRRDRPRAPVGAAGITLAVSILVLSGSPAHSASPPAERLRDHSNDGRNAAALLTGICKTHEVPDPAADLGPSRTLEDVRVLLASRGVASRIRRLTYDDLVRHHGACIVPARFGRNGDGTFLVLVDANAEFATIVLAGPLVVAKMPIDEFRRRWTGLALLPTDGGFWPGTPVVVIGGVAASGFVALMFHRRRQHVSN